MHNSLPCLWTNHLPPIWKAITKYWKILVQSSKQTALYPLCAASHVCMYMYTHTHTRAGNLKSQRAAVKVYAICRIIKTWISTQKHTHTQRERRDEVWTKACGKCSWLNSASACHMPHAPHSSRSAENERERENRIASHTELLLWQQSVYYYYEEQVNCSNGNMQ